MGLRRLGWAVAVAVPAAFLGLFFLYPVASIVGRGLTGEGLDRLLGLPPGEDEEPVAAVAGLQQEELLEAGLTLHRAGPLREPLHEVLAHALGDRDRIDLDDAHAGSIAQHVRQQGVGVGEETHPISQVSPVLYATSLGCQ